MEPEAVEAYFSSSFDPPQKRSKRSRALSTTSTVAGFTRIRDATALGGELMSGKPGSSKQRKVDPGTGRSNCGFSWVVLERGEGFCSLFFAGLGLAVGMEKQFLWVLIWFGFSESIILFNYIPAPRALVEPIADVLEATSVPAVLMVSTPWSHYEVARCWRGRLRAHSEWQWKFFLYRVGPSRRRDRVSA